MNNKYNQKCHQKESIQPLKFKLTNNNLNKNYLKIKYISYK